MGTMMGPGALTTQTSLLEASQDRMLGQIKSLNVGSGNDDAKIQKGAMEFESMLLSSWLQQAEQSMATVPGAEDDEDAAGKEQMMSLGTQQLAASMAASGGIGIAKMIAKSMHAAANKAEANNGSPLAQKSTKVITGEH
ncbi:MAG: rod-binding protein [Terracidiphilus sp.]|jgi:Rod binding domain-containing protein